MGCNLSQDAPHRTCGSRFAHFDVCSLFWVLKPPTLKNTMAWFCAATRRPSATHPAGGAMSQWLEQLPIGASVEVKGPFGHIVYHGCGRFTISKAPHMARYVHWLMYMLADVLPCPAGCSPVMYLLADVALPCRMQPAHSSVPCTNHDGSSLIGEPPLLAGYVCHHNVFLGPSDLLPLMQHATTCVVAGDVAPISVTAASDVAVTGQSTSLLEAQASHLATNSSRP